MSVFTLGQIGQLRSILDNPLFVLEAQNIVERVSAMKDAASDSPHTKEVQLELRSACNAMKRLSPAARGHVDRLMRGLGFTFRDRFGCGSLVVHHVSHGDKETVAEG